jgi:hypothetical protein
MIDLLPVGLIVAVIGADPTRVLIIRSSWEALD